MNLLGSLVKIDLPWVPLLIGLFVGLGLAGGVQELRLKRAQLAHEQFKSQVFEDITNAQQEAILAEAKVTEIEHERQDIADRAAQQGAEQQARIDRLAGDLDDAQRLLLDAIKKSPAPAAPSTCTCAVPGGAGVDRSAAERVLADMLRGATEALSGVGEYADRLRAKGMTCETHADGLVKGE